ncbi:SusC/RagA family TonB-linked outer membrane protein [Mucilaginibacter polytrichastri]|uniref:SusC/RagA family TonB-linked outer membrane protein n=1 Tax=Mucilaginibacter polytrichastri TaxID=1302689 RepID=UPI0008F17979|nr:SusC/RagA family TonB-linked outer membrane protein [Mucilaginibacter polytrichastri]SFS44641.1 TonB-linked outer membrane protein, SusC/RagA family [Mucilaginibacter polytrichastri]
MKRHLLFLLCFIVLCTEHVFAQNRTVTGTVTAKEDGLPLPGVTVKVKGTTIGTQTSGDGKFSLSIPGNATLVFSFIGYARQEIAATGTVVNAKLETSSKELGEVIVTGALGLTRTRNQQAYAAQQVSGDEVSKQHSSNFVSGLQGKVSGLEIRQNNGLGASTNVVLRGNKSIFSNNQALFVVDGVPFNNGAPSSSSNLAGGNLNSADQKTGRAGYDYGSPVNDLNPDDIESVTVLKGAAGSALYGSQGANGVIVITTKKAKKGLGITVNAGVTVGSIDKSTFPTYQKEYGAGYGPGYEDPTGYFWYRDIDGSGTKQLITPLTEDASYGAKFDPNLKVYQWNAFYPGLSTTGQATPWVAAKNDPSTFFQHSVSNNQSIFITNANDNGSIKFGYTRNNDVGILPNSNILKNAVNFGGTYNVTPKLTVGANIDYTRTDGLGRYGTGYTSDNLMTNFRQWWQVNTDIKQLKDAYYATGEKNATWNLSDFNDPTAIYWDNPYFVRYQNYESDSRNRYFGNVNASYKVNSWINVTGRVTVDNWNSLQEERRAVGSTGVSSYTRRNLGWNETDYDLLANMDKNLSNDFNLKALIGTNIRKQRYQSIYATTNSGLVVPDVYALTNSLAAPAAPLEDDQRREVDGIFAGATLTWKKMLVLDGTIRRDVSSTLPTNNNTFYYPSINGGFVFSELLKNQSWLSYGKVRLNYAEVGNDAPIYSLYTYNTLGTPINGQPQANIATTKSNPDLKPEKSKSKEAGLEMQFFKNRLGFDATYYENKTINQIIPVTVSPAYGFLSQYYNSGTVQNKGIEVSLNGTPIQSENFSWKVNVNWSRNRSKVVELFTDPAGNAITNIQTASFQGNVTLNATLGQPLGTLRGTDFIYKNGQKVIGDDGYYEQTSTANNVIGNVNPNWIGGIGNTFRFKDWTFSFLIDVRKGGSVFSLDTYYGMDTGLYPETAGLNDLGNPSRSPISAGGGVILKGITEAGTPNTVRVENTGTGLYGYENNPQKAFVYDAGFVKLREALLGYSLPKRFVSKLGPVKGIDLSLVGRNLWIIHKNVPYSDPEEGLSSGNLQGYQGGAYPAVRTLSFNAKFSF